MLKATFEQRRTTAGLRETGTLNGKPARLIGFNSQATTYVWIAETKDGTKYRLTYREAYDSFKENRS